VIEAAEVDLMDFGDEGVGDCGEPGGEEDVSIEFVAICLIELIAKNE
jgi:hypothetical protein